MLRELRDNSVFSTNRQKRWRSTVFLWNLSSGNNGLLCCWQLKMWIFLLKTTRMARNCQNWVFSEINHRISKISLFLKSLHHLCMIFEGIRNGSCFQVLDSKIHTVFRYDLIRFFTVHEKESVLCMFWTKLSKHQLKLILNNGKEEFVIFSLPWFW